MAYRVELTPTAVRELENLPKHVQKRIARWLNRLAQNPRCPGHRKLEGNNAFYRIHASKDHVIVYQIVDDRVLVLVVRVADRKEVYRRLPDPVTFPKPGPSPKKPEENGNKSRRT